MTYARKHELSRVFFFTPWPTQAFGGLGADACLVDFFFEMTAGFSIQLPSLELSWKTRHLAQLQLHLVKKKQKCEELGKGERRCDLYIYTLHPPSFKNTFDISWNSGHDLSKHFVICFVFVVSGRCSARAFPWHGHRPWFST